MTPEEIAWSAAMFEGEGCVGPSLLRRPGDKDYWYVKVRVISTDRDVLERLHEMTGVGGIYTRKNYHKAQHKQAYEWGTSGVTALELLGLWWPWLGARRRARAQEVADQCGRVLVGKPGEWLR